MADRPACFCFSLCVFSDRRYPVSLVFFLMRLTPGNRQSWQLVGTLLPGRCCFPNVAGARIYLSIKGKAGYCRKWYRYCFT